MASNYSIPVIPAAELSYERALNEFFIPNLPFIISEATNEWSCQQIWISSSLASDEDLNLKKENEILEGSHTNDMMNGEKVPNWDNLSRNYGHFKVNVLQCPIQDDSPTSEETEKQDENENENEEEGEEYGSGEMIEMTFNQVIELWKDGKGKGLYVKDWHLPLQVRNERKTSCSTGEGGNRKTESSFKSSLGRFDGLSITSDDSQTETSSASIDTNQTEDNTTSTVNIGKETVKTEEEEMFYKTRSIFKNDWMNNYYSNQTNDDFTFVYFGTKDTFTPLHRDVCEFLF